FELSGAGRDVQLEPHALPGAVDEPHASPELLRDAAYELQANASTCRLIDSTSRGERRSCEQRQDVFIARPRCLDASVRSCAAKRLQVHPAAIVLARHDQAPACSSEPD